jgi:predicted nucleic acid-binding protein
MIVVSNTTPLIALACIQRFDLLQRLFGELRIAQAVYDEAVVAGREAGGAKRKCPQPLLSRPPESRAA